MQIFSARSGSQRKDKADNMIKYIDALLRDVKNAMRSFCRPAGGFMIWGKRDAAMTRNVKGSWKWFQVAKKGWTACHRHMTEKEYCLLGYQTKCTTEWGLLSFIHMQSQSNEHPLHNPSRTWPSLKALHQCALFYPNSALKNPLFSTELSLSDLHQAFAPCTHHRVRLLMIIHLLDGEQRGLKKWPW